jgi:hypothetical protein
MRLAPIEHPLPAPGQPGPADPGPGACYAPFVTERRRVPVKKDSKRPAARPAISEAIELARAAATPEDCQCPRLDAADWHEVESEWSDIAFIKSHVNAAMGVPVGYGNAVYALNARAGRQGLTVPEDPMILLGAGNLRRPLLLEVEAPPEFKGAVRPGGVAYSRLVPAPMGQMKSAVAETVAAARNRYGRKPDAVWLWYLTCRLCSSGRNFETLVLAHFRDR